MQSVPAAAAVVVVSCVFNSKPHLVNSSQIAGKLEGRVLS